jgi:hypothetical protein
LTAKAREITEKLCGVRTKHITPGNKALVKAALKKFMELVGDCEPVAMTATVAKYYEPIFVQETYRVIDHFIDEGLQATYTMRDMGFEVEYYVKAGLSRGRPGVSIYIEYTIRFHGEAAYVLREISVSDNQVLFLGN